MFTSNLTKQQGKAGVMKSYCCSLHPSCITRLSAAISYRRGPSSEVRDNAVTTSYLGDTGILSGHGNAREI
jgi:hypothetical protein